MLLQAGMLQKGLMKKIDPVWILSENHSTSDVFRNPQMVHNIHQNGGLYIKIYCNNGNHCITKKSTLKGYGTLWFDDGSITNIPSFSSIREKYSIRYDNEGK